MWRLRILARTDGLVCVVDYSRPMLDRTIALGRTVDGATRWAEEYLRKAGEPHDVVRQS